LSRPSTAAIVLLRRRVQGCDRFDAALKARRPGAEVPAGTKASRRFRLRDCEREGAAVRHRRC
jgi:hypothetical protein